MCECVNPALFAFGLWSAGGTSSSRQYTYDGLNRLTALYDGAASPRSYAYDPYGNLTNLGGTPIVPNPATNRISSVNNVAIPAHPAHGYWDVRGNLSRIPDFLSPQREKEFAFSTEDRLMQSVDVGYSAMWRYAYDTAGERVVSWATDGLGHTGEARITIRDEGGMALTDWLWTGGAAPSFERSRDYLYAGGRMVAQVDWGAGTPTRRFAAVDHLGSTRYLVGLDDALGVIAEEALEFYPFGQFKFDGTPPDPDTTHLFTGHERDLGLHLSELDYMHARYYSPNLGRFLSVDPVGGTIGSSQSWNRYSYVLNNPIVLIDPDGQKERKGITAGTVKNKSSKTIWIAGDFGDREGVVVIPLNPGEKSTDFLVDTDAILVDSENSIDGEDSGAFKLGTSDVTVEDDDSGLDLDRDGEYLLNKAAGRAGHVSPGEKGWDGQWVIPETDEDKEEAEEMKAALEAKRKEEDKKEKPGNG